MAIRFRLGELLDQREMTQTALQHATRLAYSTISELYHNKVRRIDVGTLDTLCAALDCQVGDLIEYVPERPEKPASLRARGPARP